MGQRIGVDVGGTFTDVVSIDDGELTIEKVATTPAAPESGVLGGLERSPEAEIDRLAHATTAATNAILERSWAPTALVTTAGCRDVLAIGRQDRPSIYELHDSQPAPIVPRERRYEVAGRLDERGREIEPLDEARLREIGTAIAAGDAASVAICFLFAFESDRHERRAATVLRDAGVDVPITCSSDVLPEIREYERSAATALNAGLIPVVSTYIDRLEAGLAEADHSTSVSVMQSSGGLAPAEEVTERPVTTALSGPAAGVQGGIAVADRTGEDDILTMDMGGTSCDVALVRDGSPTVATERELGGYPLPLPMIDVHTVGAGGGSIAWIDEGGAVRIGPRSAGARPGPVCYGRGGTEPTVTDAQYLLGRIDPQRFLGEAFEPDRETVREAFAPIADAVDGDVEAAARGVLEVATATMERAVRTVTVERGVDPRSLALVAYGGGGPLHAPAVADALGIERVLVPSRAGVLSAYGLLASDAVATASESAVRPWAAVDAADLTAHCERLAARAADRLGDRAGDPLFEHRLELRYREQTHTLPVTVEPPIDPDAVADRFHERHHERFGHAAPDEPLTLETIRVLARRPTDPPPLEPTDPASTLAEARRETASVAVAGGRHTTPIYERETLPVGESIDGPAIAAGRDHTVFVPTDWSGTVDEHGTLVLEVSP